MNANYFIVRVSPGHLWVFAWNRFGAGAELVVVLREVNRKTEMNQRFRENRHIFLHIGGSCAAAQEFKLFYRVHGARTLFDLTLESLLSISRACLHTAKGSKDRDELTIP